MMQQARRATATEPNARAVLAALADAHVELRRELANMEELQSERSPPAERWAYARWKLSRASRTRRTCMEQAYPLALAAATTSERVRVGQLQAQDPVMLAMSADHIARWTPERISGDWAGYCAASRVIRRSLTGRIRAEEEVVVPILARLTRG